MRKKPTETQLKCLRAIEVLTREDGRAPSTAQVAGWLGCNRSSARRLMLACKAGGWMRAPEAVVVGEWALTAAGKREIDG
jgi:hypothetical protein